MKSCNSNKAFITLFLFYEQEKRMALVIIAIQLATDLLIVA